MPEASAEGELGASASGSTTLDTVRKRVQEGIDAGLHSGAQLYVSRHAEPIANFALGEARPGEAMTRAHLLPWYSAGKPLTALAIAQQWEAARLQLDAPVTRHVPEFAQHGKDAITIRHLLTHTAGIRTEPYRFPDDDWHTIIAKLGTMRPEPRWTPGEKAGYHPLSSWWLLAEIVQRISGEAIGDYLRKHILEPLDMRDTWLGIPRAHLDAYGPRIAPIYDTTTNPPAVRPTSTRDHLTRPKPGGNALGPIRELGRLYETLLRGGEYHQQRIVQPRTIEHFTTPHRRAMHDHTFGQPITWGLGFILDSKDQLPPGTPQTYGYGPHASPRTFGHGGVQSSIAFADPAHDLAVAIILNGAPGEKAHQQRMHRLLTALYEDLALA